MNLDTITMDRVQARAQYEEYRAAVRAGGGSPEDEMIAKGYHALAMGRKVLSLNAAMKTAGLGNDGYPKCAIARADAKQVSVQMRMDRSMEMRTGSRRGQHFEWPVGFVEGRLPTALTAWEEFNARQIDENKRQTWHSTSARAMVPIIPAALRPAGALTNYHIFFEVEKWAQVAPPAPRDPALLRLIGGDLYAVLAVWDLTELERAVLAGTR